MSDCTQDCSSCASGCSGAQDLRTPLNKASSVGHVIAIMSGKGGVGKSTVTASLAVAMARLGKKVGILDADITGPSIPASFGIHQQTFGSDDGIIPAVTAAGIKLMSLNLLTANETDPVVWRGAVISGVVQQFWSDVVWGDLDYLFIDMPPGTGDVPLTVFQSLPVDGAVIVTTPQDLVSMIVTKAVNMAHMMSVPLLGLVENYSTFRCPDCGAQHAIFGDSKLELVAKDLGLEVLAKLPIDPEIAAAMDMGIIERVEKTYLEEVATKIVASHTEN